MNAPEETSASDAARVEAGRRIRSRRKKLGLSQQDLGDRLVNENGKAAARSQVSKWERGVFLPDWPYRPQLCDALDAPDLFDGLAPNDGPELLANRFDELDAKVDALIRILDLEGAVAKTVRAASRSRIATAGASPDGEAPESPTDLIPPEDRGDDEDAAGTA